MKNRLNSKLVVLLFFLSDYCILRERGGGGSGSAINEALYFFFSKFYHIFAKIEHHLKNVQVLSLGFFFSSKSSGKCVN